MKVFIIIPVTLLGLALAQKGGKAGKNGKDEACGIDLITMKGLCVVGTDMGAKMETAFADCYNGPTERKGKGKKGKGKGGKGGGKKGKGKGGKGDTCPNFEDLLNKIYAENADHKCFMEKMEWVDNEGNMAPDVHAADMASLNTALTEKIDQQGIEDCTAEMMGKMSKEGEQCASSYNDDQLATLATIGEAMAEGACSHKAFMTACQEYVIESFKTFLTTAKTDENEESSNGGGGKGGNGGKGAGGKGGKQGGKGGKGGKKGKGKKGK